MLRALSCLRLLLPVALIVTGHGHVRFHIFPSLAVDARKIAMGQAIVVSGASLDPLGRCVPLTSDLCSETISSLSAGGTAKAGADASLIFP